jgi:raffinose/stachyose/melibiose transport system substrate-binding protein
MKELYDAGFFPENTLTAKDAETCRLFADGKAAFALEGSWKIGWLLDNAADHLDDYVVTWAPGKGSRKATDIVGGISMGYYITRKAWEDPEKREAAVDFVRHMTSDEALARFSNNGIAPTALAKAPAAGEKATPLIRSAIDMFAGQTGSVSAVQDLLTGSAREALFGGVKNVVIGAEKADALIENTMSLNKKV